MLIQRNLLMSSRCVRETIQRTDPQHICSFHAEVTWRDSQASFFFLIYSSTFFSCIWKKMTHIFYCTDLLWCSARDGKERSKSGFKPYLWLLDSGADLCQFRLLLLFVLGCHRWQLGIVRDAKHPSFPIGMPSSVVHYCRNCSFFMHGILKWSSFCTWE